MNLYEIERYSSNHPDWEGSFSEKLYEYCEWDINEFWKLHKTLTELAIVFRKESLIDKELMGRILGIQKSIYTMITAHYDTNDVVNIKNITEEELHQFKERFDMAIMALTTGDVLKEESFDLVNPLL